MGDAVGITDGVTNGVADGVTDGVADGIADGVGEWVKFVSIVDEFCGSVDNIRERNPATNASPD